MRILFVAHFFQPEPNFFYGLPFAKRLVELGHEVEVLTGFPNYPAGKIYEGYKVKCIHREVMEGIPIIRVPLYPSHNESALGRIACYSSLALSAATIGIAAVKHADVAFIGQGPTTIGLPGIILKLFRGIPYVYYIQDLWPDCLASTNMFTNRFALKLTGQWCKLTYKAAGKIAVISPGYKRKLIERGIPENKVELIYNWCDEALICNNKQDDQLPASLGMPGKFNIVFAGNMGKAQSVETILHAAQLLQPDVPQVQFLLFGGGVEVDQLKQKANQMQLQNVKFFDRKPVSEIGAILRLADVLLVHLRDEPVYEFTIPSKTQAYMAVGRPVLIGVRGDAADLVTNNNAGLACEPENAHDMAEKIKTFVAMPRDQRDAMGQNGKTFYYQNMSFDIGTRRFLQLFESLAKKQRYKAPS
jgi:colanic acid biosynthesis glycosyl transferase WcaI